MNERADEWLSKETTHTSPPKPGKAWAAFPGCQCTPRMPPSLCVPVLCAVSPKSSDRVVHTQITGPGTCQSFLVLPGVFPGSRKGIPEQAGRAAASPGGWALQNLFPALEFVSPSTCAIARRVQGGVSLSPWLHFGLPLLSVSFSHQNKHCNYLDPLYLCSPPLHHQGLSPISVPPTGTMLALLPPVLSFPFGAAPAFCLPIGHCLLGPFALPSAPPDVDSPKASARVTSLFHSVALNADVSQHYIGSPDPATPWSHAYRCHLILGLGCPSGISRLLDPTEKEPLVPPPICPVSSSCQMQQCPPRSASPTQDPLLSPPWCPAAPTHKACHHRNPNLLHSMPTTPASTLDS